MSGGTLYVPKHAAPGGVRAHGLSFGTVRCRHGLYPYAVRANNPSEQRLYDGLWHSDPRPADAITSSVVELETGLRLVPCDQLGYRRGTMRRTSPATSTSTT